MFRSILFFSMMSVCAIVVAQENNLNTFVASQNEKLVYDQSKLVIAPNTNVKIIPPEHYIPDASINGFVHPGSASTIQIQEIPGISFTTIEQSMTSEYIVSQNYEFVEKVNLTTNKNKNAVIYFVQFTSGETVYERAMFFTGDQNTIWINFNYPLSMKKLLYPAIEACLKSVE